MNLINYYGIQLGDKVSRLKRGLPFIRHYAVYIGTDQIGRHCFIENNIDNGVQVINEVYFFRDATSIKVESISQTFAQRHRAVAFAKKKIGTKYSLLGYNCEHFANEVTIGIRKSEQVSLGLGLMTLALGGMIIRNNSN